jgi:hypothetical protein
MPHFLDDSPLTPEQMAARQIRQTFRDLIHQAVFALEQEHQQLWMMDGVATQDIYDEFTTLGGKERDAHDAIVTFITSMATANGLTIGDYIDSAQYAPTGGHTLTTNMDGTVTVT